MSEQDIGAPSGTGSHASHEAAGASSPIGFDPLRDGYAQDVYERQALLRALHERHWWQAYREMDIAAGRQPSQP